ncbi:hypothetical protein KCU77_g24521, partial [Aureobasidium melanogenum]
MIRFPARLRRAFLIACLIILVYKFILGGDFSAAPATIESNAASILGWQSSEPE